MGIAEKIAKEIQDTANRIVQGREDAHYWHPPENWDGLSQEQRDVLIAVVEELLQRGVFHAGHASQWMEAHAAKDSLGTPKVEDTPTGRVLHHQDQKEG